MKKKLADPRTWIAIASAAGVAGVALVDSDATSPGPLAAAHERELDLAGRGGCAECHGGWLQGMAEACLDCHADVGEDLEAGAGVHGRLPSELHQRCALCHSDHHGTSFALVNRRSFELAGIADPNLFDHGLVGFRMEGAHLALACNECHLHAEDALLPVGGKRFLGLDQDCASCHEDPHEGRMGRSCESCHDQQDFLCVAFDAHVEHLPLSGGHGGIDCRTCHAEDDAHALESLGESARKPNARTCLSCHESPHAESFVAGVALQAGMSEPASCVVCHEAEHESFREEGLTVSDAQHAGSGFLLDPPHGGLACADCHAPEEERFAARYPRRGQDDCASCHADPHGGQFASSTFAAEGCIACHERLAFEPHRFGVAEHAKAGFELEASHIATECDDCHVDPPAQAPRLFRGTPARCEQCHADAHQGAFARFALELAAKPAGDCAACHEPSRFADVPEQRFDHGRWTGFPVRGAHAQAECAICHPERAARDEAGRSFGRVEERFGTVEGCASCHADVHAGTFDRAGLPLAIDGREGCARCHGETSFRALPADFDHEAWTGFALVDGHGGLSCTTCHAPAWSEGSLGLVRGPAAGRSCSDCHADPHAGQFEVEGRTDCMRCHESAASFGELDFDHARDSRYALDDTHRPLACSACHLPVVEESLEFVRYKPLGIECADCHGNQKLPLRRKERRKQ